MAALPANYNIETRRGAMGFVEGRMLGCSRVRLVAMRLVQALEALKRLVPAWAFHQQEKDALVEHGSDSNGLLNANGKQSVQAALKPSGLASVSWWQRPDRS